MAERNEKGKVGEELAKQYLINHDYKVLQTNWHAGHYEVDIIAQKDNLLVFCEVKYRTSNAFGEPESFVTRRQQQHIIKAAAFYVGKYQWQGESRFDIVSILTKKDTVNINHIEDAYGSTW